MTEVPDILTVYAAANPDKPALICGDDVLTYRAYDEQSNRAARALIALGVAPGDRVAVMTYNSLAGSVVSSGLRKAQAVAVPVNFRLRGAELAYVVQDSGARVVCAGPEFVEHVEAARPLIETSPVLVAIGHGVPPAGWVRLDEAMAGESAEALPDQPCCCVPISMPCPSTKRHAPVTPRRATALCMPVGMMGTPPSC